MADIQNIYSILLARDYQRRSSRLSGQKKEEGKGCRVDCPSVSEDNFSYTESLSGTAGVGAGGDWLEYMQSRRESFQIAFQSWQVAGVDSPLQPGSYSVYQRADILEEAQSSSKGAGEPDRKLGL